MISRTSGGLTLYPGVVLTTIHDRPYLQLSSGTEITTSPLASAIHPPFHVHKAIAANAEVNINVDLTAADLGTYVPAGQMPTYTWELYLLDGLCADSCMTNRLFQITVGFDGATGVTYPSGDCNVRHLFGIFHLFRFSEFYFGVLWIFRSFFY